MANVLHPDVDWQSRRTVIECNKRMWTDKLGCDVIFIVGQAEERIGAHKYVLGSRSCVFYAMFYGPLSGNSGQEITVPDMTPDQFNGLMQFLYTEEVKVDLNNVLALLYVAKKYCVQSLIDRCLNILKRHMVPENVCTVMENAHIYGNDDLKKRCFNLIIQETLSVFEADDLSELCKECFISIIKEDRIPVAENDVFEAVLKFGKGKCEMNDQQPTPENLNAVLADVIPHVRFPLMDKDYLLERVESSGLLNDSQLKTLYTYFLRKKQGNCEGFICKKRKSLYTVKRFAEITSGWGYKRDKCDAISFKCSEDLLIRGFQIYGSCQGPGNIEIATRLVQEPYKANVAVKHALVETDGKQKVYTIFFDNPAPIKKEKLYTFLLIVKGPTTYYGTKGGDEVLKGFVTFQFFKSDSSTNNTSPERGQLPGIVFEPMPQADASQAMEI